MREHERRPATNGAPPEKIEFHRQVPTRSERQDTATAWSIVYFPAGRRKRTLHVVEHCPYCRGPHYHLGGPGGGLRRAGCGTGRRYLVRPRPEAVAA